MISSLHRVALSFCQSIFFFLDYNQKAYHQCECPEDGWQKEGIARIPSIIWFFYLIIWLTRCTGVLKDLVNFNLCIL